jgi:hypothetical protein
MNGDDAMISKRTAALCLSRTAEIHTLFLKSRKVASSPQNSSPKALKISLAASQKAECEDDEAEAGP